MTKTLNEFVPIYEYAKTHNLSKQNVYRLIREFRFQPDDVVEETVTVTRLRIRKGALPTYRKAGGKLSTLGQ